MYLAKVRGTVISTRKTEKLDGLKLLLIQQVDNETLQYAGKPIVAVDLVGVGEGELVLICPGGSARHSLQTDKKPVDCTIVGVVDVVKVGSRTIFEKYPNQQDIQDNPGAGESIG